MKALKLYDTYKVNNSIVYIEENDITDDCPLMASQWLKRGAAVDIRSVVPLKEATEEKLSALYHKFGALTYLGNFENFDEAMKHIA